ncbi:hypothetical protein W97_01257 [Coniosporium apollinis CBS 100218]|uniref:F-box domain-containing protein n=1 Tax=Coniosporium apollinis (strain CBS 100218) TaxID=1168221 RepID=R7YJI6_CONA1|nr:uncharacterized protein W97_01257 [Coniosporium apollinis CBS 100218]EON62038.1 hypothetical protein W97_01257 [Coniosporium apollinis CBS 100218]
MEGRRPSVASTASSSELYESSGATPSPKSPTETPQTSVVGKRKREALSDGTEKRPRMTPLSEALTAGNASTCARVPPEIWQYVFHYLHPSDLISLTSVNRAFRGYLTDGNLCRAGRSVPGRLAPVNPEAIWATARHLHCAPRPKPLVGLTEMQMWQLTSGAKCQSCGKAAPAVPFTGNVWEGGPGPDGVRAIWPFGVRLCGSCLEARSKKDTELLFSLPSGLLQALPYAFVTSTRHVVPSTVLKSSTIVPPTLSISKRYFDEHIADIQRELEEARSLGPAAAEGWSRGLEEMGNNRRSAAERWELWEAKQAADRPSTKSAPTPVITTPRVVTPPVTSAYTPYTASTAAAGIPTAGPHFLPPRPPTSLAHVNHQPQQLHGLPQQHRPERNLRDANEAKAARKADIEDRCQQLNPPISANVLRHMESFQNAMQIGVPMTDSAWEVLKPRLLAQREVAERMEAEHAAHMAALQAKLEAGRPQEPSSKELKEAQDREWDDAQKPLRRRLGMYADELIRGAWSNGRSISKDNSSKFAADVLLHVRKRFYDDLAEEDEARTATGQELRQDPFNGPPARRLLLESMKWVYDNKIKSLAEPHRRELFLCKECVAEGNPKFYGFEGVLQHYGAKHTNDFSVGNVVVSWKEAEWPEEPPFHPDPGTAQAALYAVSVSGSGSAVPGQPAYAPFQYGGYSRGASSTPQMATLGLHQFSQMSPSPYGNPLYAQYSHGPFQPPPLPANGFQGPSFQQNYAQVPGGLPFNSPQQAFMAGQGPMYNSYANYAGQPNTMFSPALAPSMIADVIPAGGPQAAPDTNATNAPSLQLPATAPDAADSGSGDSPNDSTTSGSHEDHLSEIAQTAKNVWTNTSGIKDFPQSVRVFVVIHHVISKFNARFGYEPSLDLFSDALATHQLMKPIKNARGLLCKTCIRHNQRPSKGRQSQSSHLADKAYDFLSLISHFKFAHLEKVRPPRRGRSAVSHLKWAEDMIEIPDEAYIRDTLSVPGIGDDKIRAVVEVFPHLFASSPEPPAARNTSGRDMARHDPYSDRGFAQDLPQEAVHGSETRVARPRVSPPRRRRDGSIPSHESPQSLPAVGEDEYDPRHPAIDMPPRRTTVQQRSRLIQSRDVPEDDHRRRYYYAEPVEYVGDSFHRERSHRAANIETQVPRDPHDDGYGAAPRGYYRAPSPADRRREYESDVAYVEYVEVPRTSRGHLRRTSSIVPAREALVERPRTEATRPLIRYVDDPDEYVEPSVDYGPESVPETRPRPSVPKMPESDVDRFLDQLDTERGGHAGYATEHDHEMGDPGLGHVIPEHVPQEMPQHSSRMPVDTLPVAAPSGEAGTGYSSIAVTPGPPPPSGSTGPVAEPRQPASHSERRPNAIGSEQYVSRGGRFEERHVGQVRPRYARYMRVYRETAQAPIPRVARPHSRFERYEVQRRRLDRERSRSPSRLAEPELEAHQYRDRSVAHPEHDEAAQAARQSSHPPPREYIPMEEPARYSPAEPPVRYRYAEPQPLYVDEYGRPIEVVRVHEHHPPARYISEQDRIPIRYVSEHHGPSEQAYEYVPYETSPVRDDRRYVYYANQPPYEEHQRRVYEPVPEPSMASERLSERPTGPPGQEVRYVEQQR